jgi:hypothetical protein
MWVKLGNEYLNLHHIIRVRFSKSWTRDGDCLVAEVETQVNGEVKQFIRYRGSDADVLQSVLAGQALPTAAPVGVGSPVSAVPAPAGGDVSDATPAPTRLPRQSAIPTLPDM